MKKKFLAFCAFFLRLAIAPLYHHSDPDNYYYWGKYLWKTKDFLGFLGKSIPNAMPATYPPVFYYLLFVWRGLYEFLEKILWWLNLKVAFFPSNFIFWFQSYGAGIAFNKLIAIVADLFCGYLILKIVKEIGGSRKFGLVAAIAFLFLPASWYISAYWGQIESLYSLFVLLSFFLVFKDRFLWGTMTLGLSALIKPTGLFVLPVFLVYVLKKKKFIDLILGGVFLVLIAYLLYFPFQPINTLPWAVSFYFGSFKGELNYLVSNAFNFWTLLFGFDQRPDNFLFLGVPLFSYGFLIFLSIAGGICFGLWKKQSKEKLFFAAFLCAFAAFLFLPRMHERYFFTAYIFLAILSGINKKYFYIFIIMSIFHFFNLYHFWWHPKIPWLIGLLSNMTVIRGIIGISLGIFLYTLINFLKNEPFDNHR